MAIKTFTTGEVLTASDTNTYLANSGLVYITSTSATSGTSLSINNCFTSTYTSYQIVVTRASVTTSVTGFYLRLRASGTDTSANYYNIRTGYDYGTTAIATSAVNNGTQFELGLIADTTNSACIIDIHNPQTALKTTCSSKGADSRTTGYGNLTSGGMLNNTTSYDGFTILSSPLTIAQLDVTIYGFRKA